jgi:hypothetical protein
MEQYCNIFGTLAEQVRYILLVPVPEQFHASEHKNKNLMVEIDISDIDEYGFGSLELIRFSLTEHYYKKVLTEGISYRIKLRLRGEVTFLEFLHHESKEALTIDTYTKGGKP